MHERSRYNGRCQGRRKTASSLEPSFVPGWNDYDQSKMELLPITCKVNNTKTWRSSCLVGKAVCELKELKYRVHFSEQACVFRQIYCQEKPSFTWLGVSLCSSTGDNLFSSPEYINRSNNADLEISECRLVRKEASLWL